jgi:peptidoglycan hydrolase CwlO-like protein
LERQEELRALQSKQGRKQQFKSKEERDRHLQNDISKLEATLKSFNEQEKNQRKEVQSIKAELKKLDDQVCKVLISWCLILC